MAHFFALFLQTEAAERRSNDKAEVQSRNGVHGLIAVGKTLEKGCGGVIMLRRGDMDAPTK